MPMYEYLCRECKTSQNVFKPMADYQTPEPCAGCSRPMDKVLSAPAVRGDYAGYSCPITNKWIEGRRAHIENLKLHGCRVLESGETTAIARNRKADEATFDAMIERSVDEEITKLPARKRESLAAECEAGFTAEIVRLPGQPL